MTTKKKARDPKAIMRGELIRSARTAKGMSQATLANAVGVERESVSQWESGDIVEIKASNATKLANILGMSFREITEGAAGSVDQDLLSSIIEMVDDVLDELYLADEWSASKKASFITDIYEEYVDKGKEAVTKDNVILFAKFARDRPQPRD